MLNRRDFLKVAGTTTAATALGTRVYALSTPAVSAVPVSPNDHIQIALIGAGGQGQYDTRVAAQVPGVKVVAAADCYDGRLEHCRTGDARQSQVSDDDVVREFGQFLERLLAGRGFGDDIAALSELRRDDGAKRGFVLDEEKVFGAARHR